jgi:hypothetical protein
MAMTLPYVGGQIVQRPFQMIRTPRHEGANGKDACPSRRSTTHRITK